MDNKISLGYTEFAAAYERGRKQGQRIVPEVAVRIAHRRLLMAMTARQLAVYELSVVEGCSTAEIAAFAQMSETDVRAAARCIEELEELYLEIN